MTYPNAAQQEAYEAYLARVDVPTLVVELRARIEALTAERNAAVAKLDIAERDATIVYDAAITEGERRATAAIVAWLRGDALGVRKYGYFGDDLADAIERGDHITEAKPRT